MSNQNQGNSKGGTHEQHVQSGQQSHKNSQQEQSNTAGNRQQGANERSNSTGTQGGSSEQHAAAGRQSHKNNDNR